MQLLMKLASAVEGAYLDRITIALVGAAAWPALNSLPAVDMIAIVTMRPMALSAM